MKLNLLILLCASMLLVAGCGGSGSGAASNGASGDANSAVASANATVATSAQQLKAPVIHCAPVINTTTQGTDVLHAKTGDAAKVCR